MDSTGWITDQMWQEPVKQGYLGLIEALSVKSQEQRYFRLQGNQLFYFADRDSPELLGNIPLQGMRFYSSGMFTEKYGPTAFSIFCRSFGKTFFLISRNEAEKQEWEKALLACSTLQQQTTRVSENSQSMGAPDINSGDGNSGGEVRTLFITGLPEDIKEREIHNLFRSCPGYDGCRLGDGNPPVAFASFADRKSAEDARRLFQGIRFDPGSQVTLRITFAKSNSKTKRLPPDEFFINQLKTCPRCSFPSSPTSSGGAIESVNTTPMLPVGSSRRISSRGTGHDTSSRSSNNDPSIINSLQNLALISHKQTHFPPNTTHNTNTTYSGKQKPCSTLFIANLHPSTVEADLRLLFQRTVGFKNLKMYYGKDTAPVCFVEYTDIESSTKAMETMHGSPFGTTQLRIEYAKKRMGGSTLAGDALGEDLAESDGKSEYHNVVSPREDYYY